MAQISKVLKEKILHLLSETRGIDFENKVEALPEKNLPNFYSQVIYILTHKEFTEEEAKECFQNIKTHRKLMEEKLNRPVSFHVAMIDYFSYEKSLIQNPLVVDVYLFDLAEKFIFIDELTGLYNNRYLRDALWREVKRSRRYKSPFSVTYIQIDDYAGIVKKYGRENAEEALKAVAKVLKTDRRGEDVQIRSGDATFVVILVETTKENAVCFAKRIKKDVEKRPVVCPNNVSYDITLSIGISGFPDDTKDPVELLELAEKALDKAVESGGNKIVLAEVEKDEV